LQDWGLHSPVALAILNVTYSDARDRARAIAIWGGMNGLAGAIGPTLGGLLVDAFGAKPVLRGLAG
jgi:MFS transporter, DHA2 family, methylenomycin A resistance protein